MRDYYKLYSMHFTFDLLTFIVGYIFVTKYVICNFPRALFRSRSRLNMILNIIFDLLGIHMHYVYLISVLNLFHSLLK